MNETLLPPWFLVLSLFLPRIALIAAFLTDGVECAHGVSHSSCSGSHCHCHGDGHLYMVLDSLGHHDPRVAGFQCSVHHQQEKLVLTSSCNPV